MTTKRPHVAVIGAGVAGLSCARQLQGAGYQVTVFDKGGMPGGRMSTRRGVGWQCDHGAQYFTARDPRFIEEVERWEQAGVAAMWTPRLAVLGGPTSAPDRRGIARFVGVPRMNAPLEWMAGGLVVKNRVAINDMRHDQAGWLLESAQHGRHAERYDAVLLAVPAPQAAVLLEPLLPLTALQASAVTMQPCWALMMRLEQRHDPGYDAAFINDGPLRWLARDSSKPGRQGDEMWVAQASMEWSAAHIDAAESEVAAQLGAAFERLGGPPPAEIVVHRWRFANAMAQSRRGAVWLPAVNVGLCGDWLRGGRVEDAWLSGKALAATVLASLPVAAVQPA